MTPRLQIAGCLLLALLISIIGIGTNDFWDDEANTAVFGRNFMETGSPTGWDGHNLLSYGMAGSLGADLCKNGPPLQYIMAGISLKIFGYTTAGGRMLFLLVGACTIIFAALWYREETGYENLWTVALILALSVPFLLYIRQVRYYSPGLCFTFVFLWTWVRIKRAKRFWPWALTAVLSLALLVLTSYLHAAAALAVAGAGFVRKQYRNRKNTRLFNGVIGLGVLALIGAFFYDRVVVNMAFSPQSGAAFRFLKAFEILKDAPLDMLRFEFFPAGMLLFCLPGVWMLKRRAIPFIRQIGVLMLYGGAVMAAVAFFSPQPDSDYNLGIRYAIAIIPMAAAAGGVITAMLTAAGLKKTVWVFLAVLLSSNLLTFNFATGLGLHCRIGQFLHENIVDYTTGSEAIGDYIETNIPKASCLFMVPLHTAIIQMFYHPDHTFCGMVSEQATVAVHNRDVLRESLFFETTVPDFFIIMRLVENEARHLLDMSYGKGAYELKDVLYVYGENLTRPEIPWRSFGPVEPKFSGEYRVFVFERTGAPAHVPAISAGLFEQYIAF